MLLEYKEPLKLSATVYFWFNDLTPHSHNTFWNLPRRQHWSHQHIWKSVSQVCNWVVSIHPLFPMIETGSVLTSSHNSACRCWELLFFILIKTIIKSSSWPFDLKLLEQSNNDRSCQLQPVNYYQRNFWMKCFCQSHLLNLYFCHRSTFNSPSGRIIVFLLIYEIDKSYHNHFIVINPNPMSFIDRKKETSNTIPKNAIFISIWIFFFSYTRNLSYRSNCLIFVEMMRVVWGAFSWAHSLIFWQIPELECILCNWCSFPNLTPSLRSQFLCGFSQ